MVLQSDVPGDDTPVTLQLKHNSSRGSQILVGQATVMIQDLLGTNDRA